MTANMSDVLLLGATGTIGRATARALRVEGHTVHAMVRPGAATDDLPERTLIRSAVSDRHALEKVFQDHRFDAVVSCLASRTGLSGDAWAVDHRANQGALQAAVHHGVKRFILLSAICVQKPELAFQHAKLAFEAELQAAPIPWTIIRPTAFFKSLSGQFERCRKGKPFLVFGRGDATACKPISNADLARFIALSLSDAATENKIMPIGGPGPAITPKEQGALLFDALDMPPRFSHVPLGLINAIVAGLTPLGAVSRRFAEKAEFAKIGRYYSRESMLVWDTKQGRYDANATPEFGSDSLADHYRKIATEEVPDDRGAHAVF